MTQRSNNNKYAAMKHIFHHPISNTVKQFNNVSNLASYYINKYQAYLLIFIGR